MANTKIRLLETSLKRNTYELKKFKTRQFAEFSRIVNDLKEIIASCRRDQATSQAQIRELENQLDITRERLAEFNNLLTSKEKLVEPAQATVAIKTRSESLSSSQAASLANKSFNHGSEMLEDLLLDQYSQDDIRFIKKEMEEFLMDPCLSFEMRQCSRSIDEIKEWLLNGALPNDDSN